MASLLFVLPVSIDYWAEQRISKIRDQSHTVQGTCTDIKQRVGPVTFRTRLEVDARTN